MAGMSGSTDSSRTEHGLRRAGKDANRITSLQGISDTRKKTVQTATFYERSGIQSGTITSSDPRTESRSSRSPRHKSGTDMRQQLEKAYISPSFEHVSAGWGSQTSDLD